MHGDLQGGNAIIKPYKRFQHGGDALVCLMMEDTLYTNNDGALWIIYIIIILFTLNRDKNLKNRERIRAFSS